MTTHKSLFSKRIAVSSPFSLIKATLFLILPFLGACSNYSSTVSPGSRRAEGLATVTSHNKSLVGINSLLIAPVDVDETVMGEKGRMLNDALIAAFDSELNIDVRSLTVNAEKGASTTRQRGVKVSTTGVTTRIGSLDPKTALEAARHLGGDAVLLTSISKFQERIGSSAAVEKPAQVGFTMRIVRLGDEREVWSAVYAFQDKALTDNLFRVKENLEGENGLGWKKAHEIIQGAFRGAARDFSEKRMAEFLR